MGFPQSRHRALWLASLLAATCLWAVQPVAASPGPEPAAPEVFGLAPARGRQGKAVTVTVSGSGFVQGASVDFGPGIRVLSAVVSRPSGDGPGPLLDHILTVHIRIERRAPLGPRDVTVTNPDTTSDTHADAFTVLRRRR